MNSLFLLSLIAHILGDFLFQSNAIAKGRSSSDYEGFTLSLIHIWDGLSLTKKDKKDIKFGLKQGVDIICLSYVTSSNNIIELRRYLDSLNINTDNLKIWAKIECNEGYLNFNDILKVSDGIILGRGDLKGEVPIDKIPIIEDKLINIMKKNNKPFVIATYIFDSMAKSLVPSISEVNDIYKYSLNKVNGLMLSTELTRAKNPVYLLRYLNNLLKKLKDILEKW